MLPMSYYTVQWHEEPPHDPAPVATPLHSTHWMPLEGVAQEWAAFGAEAASSTAFLIATGDVFLALSWETSALRHHREATEGSPRRAPRALLACLEGLHEASRHWSRATYWLGREAATSAQALAAQTHLLTHLASAQQHENRLACLIREVEREARRLPRSPQPQPEAEEVQP